MIAKHHRENHERSSEIANQIKRLINAAYTVGANLNTTPDQLADADTLFSLLTIADEKLVQLEKYHTIEWVGLGGNANDLTDDEIKQARGE